MSIGRCRNNIFICLCKENLPGSLFFYSYIYLNVSSLVVLWHSFDNSVRCRVLFQCEAASLLTEEMHWLTAHWWQDDRTNIALIVLAMSRSCAVSGLNIVNMKHCSIKSKLLLFVGETGTECVLTIGP